MNDCSIDLDNLDVIDEWSAGRCHGDEEMEVIDEWSDGESGGEDEADGEDDVEVIILCDDDDVDMRVDLPSEGDGL